ncbi:hypothetical protein [Marivita sp. GX14005]|uniref:ImuA family protein n=1 Tax=Marivita sp. GX14005 TaxID=2942276 RepID=UPI0020184824|nr:hypothetical protein [Marivita sp. GX14005]MCL3882152.1 hypothetical protein [Marivita sp. GX14005]
MQTAAALLSRRPHRPYPELTLGNAEIALRLGRVHELCGPARRTLALALAANAGAPILWVTTAMTEQFCADALARFVEPRDILFVRTTKIDAALWAMEEALRDGQTPVVIGDLPTAPALVPVRRLHLAAETGAGAGTCTPLALLLTPDEGGAPGIETRWSLTPAHHLAQDLTQDVAQQGRWHLDRLRARMAPPRQWLMKPGQAGLSPCAGTLSS